MIAAISQEKRELIKKIQEAVGKSNQRLIILKNINKKESVSELIERLDIPQPTVSKAIVRFHQGYHLIEYIGKKGKSPIFDKIPLLKEIGSLDKWIKTDIETVEEIEPKKIKKKKQLPTSIPFIDYKIERNANKMAEGPYVVLYLLENSIRKFIDITLTEKYQTRNWWDKAVTKSELLKKVKERKDLEGINRWHVPRGEHEIFYTDLNDLSYFFRKYNKEFEKYLDVQLWSTILDRVVKLSRNIIDHHNPLPQREINRLNEILEDWKRQMKNVDPAK